MNRPRLRFAFWRYVTAVLLMLGGFSRGMADEGIPADTLKGLKAATVFVKVDMGRVQSTGSGFLIMTDEKTGYIVTNEHVVAAPKGLAVRSLQVEFRSETKDEEVVKAELLAADPSRDLALLKVVDVKEMPKPIDLDQKVELTETMTVYVFGFPFGEALATSKGNPAITVGKGTISSLRENDFGDLALVQIDGAINPGNSGGPVLDSKGRLIGVSVAAIRGANIGIAIPPTQVSLLLHGRICGDGYRTLAIEDGKAELEVEIRLIDPLNKIKSVTLFHVGAGILKEMPKPDKKGRYDVIPGTEKVEVKIENQKGTAKIKVPYDKANPRIIFQHGYVTGEGKQLYTQPVPFEPMLVAVKPNPNPVDPPIEAVPKDGLEGIEGEPGKDLEVAGKIQSFFGIAFAPDAKSVLVVGTGRFLRHYSYPDFKFQGAYRMPKVGHCCALDAKKGLLYVAVADRKAFDRLTPWDRPRVRGDIHIYEVKDILDGKGKHGGELLPAAELHLDGIVTDMHIAPQGDYVYFLNLKDSQAPVASRINAEKKTFDKHYKLANYIDGLRMSGDGKKLYAFGSLYSHQDNQQQREGRIRIIDPVEMKYQGVFVVDVDPFDLAIRDDGMAYCSCRRQGGDTGFGVIDLNKGAVIARWDNASPTQYLGVSPNQKRLYFSTAGGNSPMIHSVLLEKELQPTWPKGGAQVYEDKDRPLGVEFWFSPDGRYLVNRRGTIFWLGKNKSDREPLPAPHGNYGVTEERGKELSYAGGIVSFLDMAFAVDKKLVFVAGPTRMIRVYSYPGFELKAAYRIQEIGYRIALDSKNGLLYVATSGAKGLEHHSWLHRPGGIGDIHVYDVAAVLEGKAEGPNEFKLVGDFQLDLKVSHLLLSPDGDWLYYLDIKAPEKPKAGRINTRKKELAGEIKLAKNTESLCMRKDGKQVYAVATVSGHRPPPQEKIPWEGKIQIIDAASWKLEKSFHIDVDPMEVVMRDDGVMILTSGMENDAEITFVDVVNEQVIGRWKPSLEELYIVLHPDQSRVYLSYRGGSPCYINCWAIGGKPEDIPKNKENHRGAVADSPKGRLGGEIYISPDGEFIISRWGSIFWTGKKPPAK